MLSSGPRARQLARAPLLLRDFVQHALYNGSTGYFLSGAPVVGGVAEPIAFHELRDEASYREAVSAAYAAHPTAGRAWLTPVETFRPHYGAAIARSIVERHERLHRPPAGGGRAAGADAPPLQVLEVGGGNGSCAVDSLSYLRAERPEVYETCRYVLVEISPRLAEAQRASLSDAGLEGWEVHEGCAVQWAADAAAGAGGGTAPVAAGLGVGPWWLCAFEVLDNLPHDKLRLSAQPDGGVVIEEAWVVPPDEPGAPASTPASAEPSSWTEVYRPLRDETLVELAELLGLTDFERVERLHEDVASEHGAFAGESLAFDVHRLLGAYAFGSPDEPLEVFVPTGCWRLLRAMAALCPRHYWTLADFAWLPRQPSGALHAPVVQTQFDGVGVPLTHDLGGDYLRLVGGADILFPTHFAHLEAMVGAAAARSGARGGADCVTLSHAEFMRRWHVAAAAGRSPTATASGFDPVVDDFTNTKVLLTGADAGWASPGG